MPNTRKGAESIAALSRSAVQMAQEWSLIKSKFDALFMLSEKEWSSPEEERLVSFSIEALLHECEISLCSFSDIMEDIHDALIHVRDFIEETEEDLFSVSGDQDAVEEAQ